MNGDKKSNFSVEVGLERRLGGPAPGAGLGVGGGGGRLPAARRVPPPSFLRACARRRHWAGGGLRSVGAAGGRRPGGRGGARSRARGALLLKVCAEAPLGCGQRGFSECRADAARSLVLATPRANP